MSIVHLTRIAAVVLTLSGILSSAITCGVNAGEPVSWHPELVVPCGLLTVAGAMAVLGWRLGRLPPAHWVHRSGPVWLALGVAMVVVLALALAG
jgi:hypothetical protein